MKEYLLNLSNKQKTIIGIIALVIIIIVFIFLYQYFYAEDNQNLDIHGLNNTTNEVVDSSEENESLLSIGTNKKKVVAHVIGEVNNPGVVTLNEGDRIIDAINAAGDKTEDADLSKINLAYMVEDGVQIYVPRIGEKKEEYITEGAGEGIVVDSSTLDSSETKESKVNINTATEDKLESLPGVGTSTAQKIIDYRTQNGKFKTIEDIKNVSGIGDAKFNNLKDHITVK